MLSSQMNAGLGETAESECFIAAFLDGGEWGKG